MTTRTLAAGFVIEQGRAAMCAPILRRRLTYWVRQARKIT